MWAPAGKREARHLANLLARGEPVKIMAPAHSRRRKGLLVLTSQRLLFVRDRWNGAIAEEYHLAVVSSITLHESAGSARVVIHCGGQATEITDVPPPEASRIVQETQRILAHVRSPMTDADAEQATGQAAEQATEEAAIDVPVEQPVRNGAPTAPAPRSMGSPPAGSTGPPPSGSVDAMMAHLRELNEMRQTGLLDDYEFAMAKARLLVDRPAR